MKNLFIATALSLFAITATAGSITFKMYPDFSGDEQVLYETIQQCNGKVGDYHQVYLLAKMNLDRVGGAWDSDSDYHDDLPYADKESWKRGEIIYFGKLRELARDYATFNNSAEFCDALAEFIKSDDEINF
jgi:hypothetical protein